MGCSELGLNKSKNGFPSYSDRQKILAAYYKQTLFGKQWLPKRIDKRRVKLTFKKNWKTAILLYCFHAAGVLHTSVPYNLLGPGTYFNGEKKFLKIT